MSAERPTIDTRAWCQYQEDLLAPQADCKIIGESAVLLRDKRGTPWLLAEDSEYGPMKEVDAAAFKEWAGTIEHPFHTYGEQWFVDLQRGLLVHEHLFEAQEGTIQGIAYAISGMLGQEALRPRNYRRYLGDLLEEQKQGELVILKASDILEITERAQLD